MNRCKLCSKFYKKYPLRKRKHRINDLISMAPLECAFKGRFFNTDNWNCETMNALRDIAEQFFSYRVDMSAGSIGVVLIPEECKYQQGYIVMTWYKDRGRTARAYVFRDDSCSELLTKNTAESVINYYKKRGERSGKEN